MLLANQFQWPSMMLLRRRWCIYDIYCTCWKPLPCKRMLEVSPHFSCYWGWIPGYACVLALACAHVCILIVNCMAENFHSLLCAIWGCNKPCSQKSSCVQLSMQAHHNQQTSYSWWLLFDTVIGHTRSLENSIEDCNVDPGSLKARALYEQYVYKRLCRSWCTKAELLRSLSFFSPWSIEHFNMCLETSGF